MTRETYLGDGLYASFDGWMLKLRAPRGLTSNEDHWVGLEPEVLANLLKFIEALKPRLENEQC